MKFIHAADLHIDSPLRGLVTTDDAPVDIIRSAPREAFRRLVTLALEERVDFVILAGDIFDGDWRDVRTGMFFNKELKRLGTIPVFIARGNHDAEMEVLKRLHHPANTHTFDTRKPETIVIERLGVAIHGQSYPKRAVETDLACGYPAAVPGLTNIGVLHTSLGGYALHERYAPCTLQTLLVHDYNYWALGHVHNRQIVNEEPLVVYPGNLQGRNLRETGAKGCYLVEGERHELRATFHALDVVRWFDEQVDVSGVADATAAVSLARDRVTALAEANRNSLVCVRAELIGATSAHVSLVADREIHEASIRSHIAPEAWLAELRIGTLPPIDLAAIRQQDDLPGALFRFIEAMRTNPQLRDSLRETLLPIQGKIPSRVLAEYRTRLDDNGILQDIINGAERILIGELSV